MNYDEDKVDSYTLALMYLVTHERHEGFGARAWKGFDWDTLNRLHEKGYISNPVGKTKSVLMTEEGFSKASELFREYFAAEGAAVPFPKLSAPAQRRWAEIPEHVRKRLLENVWCTECRDTVAIVLREGQMSRGNLVLRGTCKECGGPVARVIEAAGQ